MRKDNKIFIVKVSGTNSDGKEWEMENTVETEFAEDAIKMVQDKDSKFIEDKTRIATFKYTAKERPAKEDSKEQYLQDVLDNAITDALDSVDYLKRKMNDLASNLRFKRGNGCYNSSGEIQGSASSVEVEIGKVVALQKIINGLKYQK